MSTRPMLHHEVTSIIFPNPDAPVPGNEPWNQKLQEEIEKKGRVIRVEAFLNATEALRLAHQWRRRADADTTARTARVFPRTMKADGLWLTMHVLVVRERS